MKKLCILLLLILAFNTKGKAYVPNISAYSDNWKLVQVQPSSISLNIIIFSLYSGYYKDSNKEYYGWAGLYIWVEKEYMGLLASVRSKEGKRNISKSGLFKTNPSSDRITKIKLAAYGERVIYGDGLIVLVPSYVQIEF